MILICFGTRPEYLKVKPLFEAFENQGIPYKKVFTGQHEDLLKEIFFDYRLFISDSKNRLNSVFSSILLQSEEVFQRENPEYVLVQGDTSSAAAFALSAYHHKIKIIHLEAGLRTYDRENPYPEEINRQLISRIADIHLCPTKMNESNLLKEKTEGSIYVVGNTALDNLRNIETSVEKLVLITLHRRENHEQIDEWFIELEKLADKFDDYQFILPIHPNPNVQKHRGILQKIKVIEPLEHSDLIDIIKRCKLIVTDSGGIQEEASFLKKRAIICRKTTERPESLGQSGLLCGDPDKLNSFFRGAMNSYQVKGDCPYGDGFASEKVAKIIKEHLTYKNYE
jgi:UDP-N-acetylglucosamine 2-epimerase (non-hydrolysing)